MVDKTKINEDIWKAFYDRVKSVTSVIITGNKTITIQNYVAAFPSTILDSKANYPILVVNTPELSYEGLTFRDTRVNGVIEIEIYTNQSEAADKFKDKINDAIQTYQSEFTDAGIENLQLEDDRANMIEKGAIKVHIRNVRWRFEYQFT